MMKPFQVGFRIMDLAMELKSRISIGRNIH